MGPVIVYLASFPKIQTLNKLQSVPTFLQLRDGFPFYSFFFFLLMESAMNAWAVENTLSTHSFWTDIIL